jgi:CheY-like chemotaxis protein
MKALMIFPGMLASSIPDAFSKAGFKVELAETGVFALTMLERDKPDVIVSADYLGDMTGREMYDIVRSDAALNEVLFILLDGAAETRIPDSKTDLELSWMSTTNEVVRAVKDLIEMSKVKTVVAATKPVAEKISAPILTERPMLGNPPIRLKRDFDFQSEKAMKNRTIGASGTLEILTLFDLAISLTSNSKIGMLHIRIVKEQGHIFFYKGSLTDANFKGLQGEAALLAIFAMADEFKSDTEFIFEPLELASLPPEVSSIKTSIDKLLFNVAVELDHQRENRKAKV